MKYIGFYDTEKKRRSMSLAAVNKMNYISNAFASMIEPIEIIACGVVANENIDTIIEQVAEDVYVRFFKTHKRSKYKFIRAIELIRQNIILFMYLLRNVSKDEQIIVYHSLALMRCVYLAKKIKKFKIILEVEEFYNDVFLKSQVSKRMEERFIASADKYIFPTKLLNEKFNKRNKPNVIIHGTYQVEPERGVSFNDNKIHVVYAGTFDPRKGGATAAAAAAEWLPENYHIHILGFGDKNDTENIINIIKAINEKSKATVTYDGLLSGEEYIEFLQKCHIGLSTQNPDADFNATSFPSKILSYMANGLNVVTIKIPAIETSAVGNVLKYYDEQIPQEISDAIINIDFDDNYNGRKKISELHEQFIKDLKQLFLS